MVQLQILSGRRIGVKFDARRLPFTVGRSEQDDLPLDEPGVWPSHCTIQFKREGLVLVVDPNALASVNGEPTPGTVLRNGDTITLGGVTLRFSLSPARQSSTALREWLTWIALGALCLCLVALIYYLCR